ncbi:MAG: penicillin acylase family protein [Fuerstiella sp.]
MSACLISATTGLTLADEVTPATTIRRDTWGVAHIHGRTHADAFFGMGYAQAEDYFWQLEDTCIRAVGRYSEVAGEDGVRSDILNRSFETAKRSRDDFDLLTAEQKGMATAFTEGINHYLKTHPEEKPRLIDHFEPWFIVAMDRHMILDFIYRQAHVGKPQPRGENEIAERPPAERLQWNSWELPDPVETGFDVGIREAIGSNAWAISGSKTASGSAMLFINPHQPWYGMGQFYEAHIRSDEGLNFTGACFFGNPFPTIGHNEFLGWTYTVNEPDIADAWRITFDDPANPLNYRYDGGYRQATQWTETLQIKQGNKLVEQQVTFRKTHHGPIVRKDGDAYLAVQVAGLFNNDRVNQAWNMVLAKDFQQWKAAIGLCAIPMFNVVYADDQNNIFYAYNGTIPKRNPTYNWQRPVDGSIPETEWMGNHTFDELPQVLNPGCGYVQSCNSSPFTTTDVDADNPKAEEFPKYMIEDAAVDMRRSKMSRLMLKNADNVTYPQWQSMAYDTRMYWPMTEIPKLSEVYERLKTEDAALAEEVAEYWQHLQNWDCCASHESTQTTLIVAWYEELYGFGYPAETLRQDYTTDRATWFQALRKAANKINSLYGTWKHPWGDAHRLQRVADQPDVQHAGVGLNPLFDSLPCTGAPGPLGIICTVYSSPEIPLLRTQRFAVVGASYMAVVDFKNPIQAHSIVPFGTSGRRKSPHYFDQAKLYADSKLKPAWFTESEIQSDTRSSISFR